jgi:hypothetical protein
MGPSARTVFGDVSRMPDEQIKLEESFFSSLQMPNGTYKTTSSGRLKDLNELVDLHLPEKSNLRIYDAAVSSGITTAEWFRHLSVKGFAVKMYAGDAYLNGTLTTFVPGLTVLFATSGSLLQAAFLRLVYSSKPSNPLKLVLYSVARWLLTLLFRYRDLRPIRWLLREERAVKLLTRDAADLPIEFMEEDLFAPLRDIGKVDVIRIANLLNRDYFDDMALRQIVTSLRTRLVDGGLFVVGSTDDFGQNNATLFRLYENRTTVVARLGSGAPVERLIQESL